MSLVLPLDVGGTVSLPSSSLRQIRYDYMTLPFQATQCFLHGLQPIEGEWQNNELKDLFLSIAVGIDFLSPQCHIHISFMMFVLLSSGFTSFDLAPSSCFVL